jgi:AcrR family transcriptional regulator
MPKLVDHQERREQIASALMRVAAGQGLEAVSLRHVAAEAGVTSGMVQHYFPSKDSMMAFAMRSASARYEARINQAVAALGTTRPAVRS